MKLYLHAHADRGGRPAKKGAEHHITIILSNGNAIEATLVYTAGYLQIFKGEMYHSTGVQEINLKGTT